MSHIIALLLFLTLISAQLLPTQQSKHDDDDDDECRIQTHKVWKAISNIKTEKSNNGGSNSDEITTKKVDESWAMLKEQTKQMLVVFEELRKQENKLDAIQTQVQENKILTKLSLSDCRRWLQWGNFDNMNFFSTSRGKRFYLKKTPMTWHATRDWCMQKGMQLPIIKVLSEIAEVEKELEIQGFTGGGVWMDASDIKQAPGIFYWADGTQVDISTWRTGKPHRFRLGLKSCVYIHSGGNNMGLADWECSRLEYVMCQVPAALRSCL